MPVPKWATCRSPADPTWCPSGHDARHYPLRLSMAPKNITVSVSLHVKRLRPELTSRERALSRWLLHQRRVFERERGWQVGRGMIADR